MISASRVSKSYGSGPTAVRALDNFAARPSGSGEAPSGAAPLGSGNGTTHCSGVTVPQGHTS